MALDAYLRLVGATQGPIHGDVRRPGREGTIAVTSYLHTLGSEGSGAGLRPVHTPITVTKDVDHTSPLLAIAYATQEPITSWELQFIRLSQWGQEEHVFTVDLHDARIRAIRQELPDTRSPAAESQRLHENVTFAYASVELRWELGQGGETAAIPWPGRAAE